MAIISFFDLVSFANYKTNYITKETVMKKLLYAYLVLAISILFVTSLNAAVINQDKKDATVKSLAQGISSENYGLKTSAALQLGRLIDINYITQDDANKALIPLLSMLQNGNTEEERISAALALFKIGNGIGIYQLKGASRFDDSPRVRKICLNLYSVYHYNND